MKRFLTFLMVMMLTISAFAGNVVDAEEILLPEDTMYPLDNNGTSTAPEYAVLAGDVNSDAAIDSKDVVCLRRHISRWDIEINLTAANVNGDELVDSKDVVLLRRYIAKWDVDLILPEPPKEVVEWSESVNQLTNNIKDDVIYKFVNDIEGTLHVKGEDISIDLAGCTWNATSSAIIVDSGTLYVFDSVGDGKIISAAEDAICIENGQVKIENVSITAGGVDNDAIRCDGGNLLLKKCRMTAPKACVNVSNENEATDYNSRAVVTIDACTFDEYTGIDKSKKNCAIEIRNDADEIILTGDNLFLNDKILNNVDAYVDKTAAESITVNGDFVATYISGSNIGNLPTDEAVDFYWTSTIMYGEKDNEKALQNAKQEYYFKQTKTNLVGNKTDEKSWIYMLAKSKIAVREVTIDSGLGGDPVTVSQLSDLHFNYCNAQDIEENDPVIMSTLQYREWLAKGSSVPNAVRCLEMASTADQMVITGDVLDYLSWGCIELMDRHIWNQYPNALVTMGNHEPVKKVQGTVDETTSLKSRIDAVASIWKHDAYYTSRIINDKVMVIQLDNGLDVNYPGRFWECQIEPLTKDLSLAREKGYVVLVFYHIPIATNNKAEGSVVPLRKNAGGNAYFANYGTSHNADEASAQVYNLIVNNADIIKGTFCGHLHSDYYCEIVGKTPDGQVANIPQYVLTGTPYDMGHLLWITVK